MNPHTVDTGLGIEHLNEDCTCRTLDRDALCRSLEKAVGDAQFCRELIATHPHLVSHQPVFLSHAHATAMARTIMAVEALAREPAYQAAALAYAPQIAHVNPGPVGVFMGYDFHLGRDGPKLIEINTNAGGAIINAFVLRAQRACCEEMQLEMNERRGQSQIEDEFLAGFTREWLLQGRSGTPSSIAIVDETPAQQYLYPEFVLFKKHAEANGLATVIAEPQALTHRNGALWHGDRRIDVVYNRLTDFYLAADSCTSLRAAFLAGDVVVTPNPHAHAIFANKRNLALLTDAVLLRNWGVPATSSRCSLRAFPAPWS